MGRVKKHHQKAWKQEIEELVRGACGGFLFGIPLIYTMEVWWVGSVVKPPRKITAIIIVFIIVFLLNQVAGFRRKQRVRWFDAIIDSIEAIAIGIICTTLTLILLQEITWQVSLDEALGKILFESVPFAFGVALANQFLSGDRNLDNPVNNLSSSPSSDTAQRQNIDATISDIGATLIGSVIIAFNIAPTDEVSMLAAAVSGSWLLMMIVTSLAISYGIVFVANLTNQTQRIQQRGLFQKPLTETIVAYLVALLASAFMLWFFEKLSFDDAWTIWLEHSLILGLPAAIGGAAGRLSI